MAEARPIVNVIGERVALGPMRRDLLPLVHCWSNDWAAMLAEGATPLPIPLEAMPDEPTTPDDARFLVYALPEYRPVGLSRLHSIDHRHGTAELALLIGDPAERDKGYGTEAARLALDYAFAALGLGNVMLRVYEFNAAAIRAYEKAGFREIGRRRRAHRMGGRLWDEILMDCLATEFENPVLARAFGLDAARTDATDQ